MIHRGLTQCEHGCGSFVAKSTGTWKIWPHSARIMVDWKHYVKTYPWVCLGTAAALGFLIVPKRSSAICPDLATLTELAGSGHLVVKPASTAAQGLIDALLATVANIAVRKATACLGQSAGRLLGISGQDKASGHVSNCTP